MYFLHRHPTATVCLRLCVKSNIIGYESKNRNTKNSNFDNSILATSEMTINELWEYVVE